MTRRVAIVDTNVLVAGLLTGDPGSPTARIVDDMLRGRFPFVVSTALVAEYRSVLLRPRVRHLHGLSPAQVDDVLTAIVANAVVREDTSSSDDAPDPDDQHLWDLLAAMPGAVLVTGDRALGETTSTDASVLSPRAWVDLLEANASGPGS